MVKYCKEKKTAQMLCSQVLCMSALGNNAAVSLLGDVDTCKSQGASNLEALCINTEHLPQLSSLHIAGKRETAKQGGHGYI